MRLLPFILLLLCQCLMAQIPYNHRLENGQIQAIGQLVHELDNSYLGIGRGIDTIDFLGGIYASEFDKVTGELISQSKITVPNNFLSINYINSIVDVDNVPYFIFKAVDTIYLSRFSTENHKLEVDKKIVSKEPNLTFFNFDFTYQDSIFYISTDHEHLETGIRSTDIIKYNHKTDSLNEVFVTDPDGRMSSVRILFLQNENMLLSYTIYNNGAVQYLKEIDPAGNTIWKFNNEIEREGAVRAFLPMKDNNFLLGGGKGRVIIDPDGEQIPFLFKFDYEQKKIIKKFDFEIPDDEWFKWNGLVEEIIPSHDSTSFLCISDLYDFPLNPDTLKSYAMVAKVDHDLNLIWKRTYAYIDGAYFRHDFKDIIATSDGNYLAYGTSIKTFTYPGEIPILSWAIKIDEDGKIVGDTTTATIEWEDIDLVDQIEIFPNPASDYLYINQNDIEDVSYKVFDLSGKLIEEFSISDRNQSVVKSVETWTKGYNIVRMEKDGRLIGSVRVLKM